MRTPVTLAVIAALAISLSACTQAPTDTGTGSTPNPGSSSSEEATVSNLDECTTSGPGSDSVTVTGDFGAKPTVEFAAPLSTETTERTVVIEGKGDVAEVGSNVQVDFTVYNATSGKELESASTPYDGATYAPFEVSETGTLLGLAKTINCSTVGSRVVGVIPPAESWGSQGQSDIGVEPTDSIVFVVDIVAVVPPIVPEAYADMKDMPTVEFGDDGVPTVTMPKGVEAPTTTRVGIIKEGDGEVVKPGDNVTVNYHGVLWDDGTVFDSSYTRGEPASFATTGVVNGFKVALEGQKVGSQVIAVVTPADGYGASGSGSIPANATLVFVIDIISIG